MYHNNIVCSLNPSTEKLSLVLEITKLQSIHVDTPGLKERNWTIVLVFFFKNPHKLLITQMEHVLKRNVSRLPGDASKVTFQLNNDISLSVSSSPECKVEVGKHGIIPYPFITR